MGKDVKIGLALGLVVLVVIIVVFSVTGGGPEAPPPETTAVEQIPVPEPAGGAMGHVDVLIPPLRPLPDPLLGPSRELIPPEPETTADTRTERTILIDAPPARPAGRTVEHVVKNGDTLWGLAKTYYHQPALFTRIYEANKASLASPQAPLRIGMKLVIPDVPARVEATSGSAGTTASAAETGHDEYTVRPGDTLAMIAQRVYGDARLTGRIVAANPQLAANPDRIVAGWKLRIPRQATAERTATTRRDID